MLKTNITKSPELIKLVYSILLLVVVSVFSSQSFLDFVDLVICILVFHTIVKNKDFQLIKTLKAHLFFCIIWICFVFLGLYINSNNIPFTPLFEFRWVISFFCLIYLFTYYVDSNQLLNGIKKIITLLNVIAIALFIFRAENRAGGIYNAVMAFSQNISMFACFFTAYFFLNFNNLKKMDLPLILASTTSLLLVLLTQTRGILLALSIAILFTSFLINKKYFIYTIVIMLLLTFFFLNIPTSFKDRFTSKSEIAYSSNNQRISLAKANFEMLKDYPFLGVGYSQNNVRLTEYYAKLNIPQDTIKSHAHNQYLHFAAGTGLIGLSFYLFFILYIFLISKNCFQFATTPELKRICLSLISVVIGFGIAGLTEANFSISKNRFLFLFFSAWILGIYFKKSVKT